MTVDPFARRVVARRQLPAATALTASVSGGDKLVLLLGRGDARTRTVRVAVIDASGAVRTINVDLGATQGLRLPALVVEPSGRRAFVVAAGAPVFEIDLDTLAATPHVLAGAGAVFADSPLGSRQAVLLEGGILAVTGHNGRRERGVEISDPAGLAFVDTSTWQIRLVDRGVGGASVSGDTLVGYSSRIERVQRGGRPAQKLVGIGLRAYAADGTRRWQRFGTQPLTAYAFRQSALVYRHVSSPVGSGGSFVVDLADGRQIRADSGAQQNVWLLPDVSGARAVRAPAAVRETEALRVDGEGDGFRASVRDDVTRVVATLVDGSERGLAIEGGRVRYEAATPDESAHAVQAFAGDRLLASISIAVACGGSAGPCAARAEPVTGGTFAILSSRTRTTLAEIDPKTLAPLAERSIAIDRSTGAHALSADGSLAAVGSDANATVRVFATAKLDPAARTTLVAPLAPGNAGVRALEWLAPTRLVAIVQKYKRRDRRAVSARELVVLDPQAQHVIRRTALPLGRAIVDVQASGGRLVAILRSSNHRGTGITLLVAGADGRVRSREIRLRRTDGVLPETRLTLERGGKRAFLLGWQPSRQRGPQPLREIDLDRLVVTERRVTIGEGRFHLPSGFMARADSFGERGVLISGAFVPLFRDGKHVPAAGTFLLDTRTFVVRQLDARANAFAVAGDRAYAFGSTALRVSTPPRGIGVAAYASSGKRVYHAFGTRTFTRLVIAGGFGHLLRADRPQGLAFELESGRSLGAQPAPDGEIEILMPADAAPAAKAPARRPSATERPAAPGRGYTVSNRGREVPEKQPHRLFPDHPHKLFLLGTLDASAFYRVQVTPRYTCWANGKASRIGVIRSLGCPNVVGAYPFQSDNKESRGNPAGGEMQYLRIDGIVADQATSVALVDEHQQRVATVPVRANLYSFPPPYPRGFLRVVALNEDGTELKPHPEWGERQTPPPNLFGPSATRVEQPRLTAPVQQGTARGVEAKAGRNGVVVFDGSAIEPRARKLLSGPRIGMNCFVLSANHRQTRSAGITIAWGPTIAIKLVGIKAPFDGCEMQGSYGHRWRDQYGTHSAVEIPFNDRARRYFANRAAARDLALFVRSRKTQHIRKRTGGELVAALRTAYGDQVRVLVSEREVSPPGVVAVWTSGNRTVFSESSSAGVRFFVELTDGKITKESVRGLAFVF